MQQGQGPGWGQGPGYGYPTYGHYGAPPPKRPMSTGVILLIVFGALMGTCMMCGAISSGTKKGDKSTVASADPSAQANQQRAMQKAAEDAKAAREKNAVDTFPQKKTDIAAALKRAGAAADTAKWELASKELSSAENDLASFEGTSVAADKECVDLKSRASALHKRIAPQAEKIAKAAAAASAEKELQATAVTVSSMQLWSDYQANEVAADNQYKGKKVLVSGTVASIDKGPFGGLLLRLATGNEFMPTTCEMERSEQSELAQLSKGERVRVLCVCRGMVLGGPQLDDCTFR